MLGITTLNSKLNPTGVHKDPKFLNLQLRYLHRILPENAFEIKEVEDGVIHRCKGNFYKLLVILNVPSECFWLSLHINGFKHPSEFKGEVVDKQIVVVNKAFVDALAKQYSSKLNRN